MHYILHVNCKKTEVVKLLLENDRIDANIETTQSISRNNNVDEEMFETPLTVACFGTSKIVKLLLLICISKYTYCILQKRLVTEKIFNYWPIKWHVIRIAYIQMIRYKFLCF